MLLFFSLHQRTPLHLAAKEGHTNTVTYLIGYNNGADINTKDMFGVSTCIYETAIVPFLSS